MSSTKKHDVTEALPGLRRGDAAELSRLWNLIEAELRSIARHSLKRERPNPLLQTTLLLDEAFLRLIDLHRIDWKDRSHFFGVATRIIRQIVVDWARQQATQKRGGDWAREMLPESLAERAGLSPDEIVDLDEALERLSVTNPRSALVVQMRFFGGLTNGEIAEFLGVARSTVDGDWAFARSWLYRALKQPA
ncbi:MAG: ECF-type sigma factor [Planctomycetota bacterium]